VPLSSCIFSPALCTSNVSISPFSLPAVLSYSPEMLPQTSSRSIVHDRSRLRLSALFVYRSRPSMSSISFTSSSTALLVLSPSVGYICTYKWTIMIHAHLFGLYNLHEGVILWWPQVHQRVAALRLIDSSYCDCHASDRFGQASRRASALEPVDDDAKSNSDHSSCS
jgi:hypothetical protein